MTTDTFKVEWDIDCAMPQKIEITDNDLLSIGEGTYEELSDLYLDIVQEDFKNSVSAIGINFKEFMAWAKIRLQVMLEEDESA